MDAFTCRLCLGKEKLKNMLNNESLSSSVLKYLSVHVTGNDNLPTAICDKCETVIKDWNEYTLSVRKAQSILRDGLKDTSISNSVEDERSVTPEKLIENWPCPDKRMQSKFLLNEHLMATGSLTVPEDIREMLDCEDSRLTQMLLFLFVIIAVVLFVAERGITAKYFT